MGCVPQTRLKIARPTSTSLFRTPHAAPRMCVQAAGVDNCQAMLRTVAAELAAMATLEIPEEVEVDKAGTIQGVFTDVGKLSEEPTLAGASRKVYVSKLHKFFDCSNEVYIIAQVYVNRLLQKHPNLVIQADTVNEMLLASVVLALKWHEEVCDQYPDAHYALHGGVSAEKLQRLEARFLALLDWELHVTPSEFHTYCGMAAALKVELAAKENHGREEQDDGNVVPELKEDQASQDEEEEENQCESTKPLTATITATVFPASHEIRTHEIHTPHTCDDRDHEYTFKGHEHEEDDDCFPGRPLWGPQSYWTPSTFNVPQEDLPHVHADEEDARSIYSVTSDSEDCLPGKPLWCDQSYRMTSFCSTAPGTPQASGQKEGINYGESDAESVDEADDECLPGKPLWSMRSFTVASRCSTSPGASLPESEDEEEEESQEEDGDCLPGRPLWSAQSYVVSPFSEMSLGSHKQFNCASNAHTHSKETTGANKDRGFPFEGGCVANILDNKLVERMGGNGPTRPSTEGLAPCRVTEIVRGNGAIITSPSICASLVRSASAGESSDPTIAHVPKRNTSRHLVDIQCY